MAYASVAVLDANFLFPFQLRNLLLHLAAERRFEPLWSDEIVSEFLRALRRDAGLAESQCFPRSLVVRPPGNLNGSSHERAAEPRRSLPALRGSAALRQILLL